MDPFRSPLLRTSRLISLPPGTEMFQFPGFASSCEDDGQSSAGLPHSAISGSPRVCHSPELLAAYHGLHRLCVPRHPPHAFLRLTTIDVFKQNIRALFQTSDFFLRKCHLNKGFNKSHDLPCTSVVKQRRPSHAEAWEGQTIESGWTECVEAKRLTRCFPSGTPELLAIR